MSSTESTAPSRATASTSRPATTSSAVSPPVSTDMLDRLDARREEQRQLLARGRARAAHPARRRDDEPRAGRERPRDRRRDGDAGGRGPSCDRPHGPHRRRSRRPRPSLARRECRRAHRPREGSARPRGRARRARHPRVASSSRLWRRPSCRPPSIGRPCGVRSATCSQTRCGLRRAARRSPWAAAGATAGPGWRCATRVPASRRPSTRWCSSATGRVATSAIGDRPATRAAPTASGSPSPASSSRPRAASSRCGPSPASDRRSSSGCPSTPDADAAAIVAPDGIHHLADPMSPLGAAGRGLTPALSPVPYVRPVATAARRPPGRRISPCLHRKTRRSSAPACPIARGVSCPRPRRSACRCRRRPPTTQLPVTETEPPARAGRSAPQAGASHPRGRARCGRRCRCRGRRVRTRVRR